MSGEGPVEPGGAAAPGGNWRSYRCPVCGHTDAVGSEGALPARIRCTHCRTLLYVEGTVAGGERVSVHVVRDATAG